MTQEQIVRKLEELECRLRKLEKQENTMGIISKRKSQNHEVQVTSCEIDIVVMKNLQMLGIPSHLNGYKYLKTAIRLLIEGKFANNCWATMKLYQEIAKLYKKSVQQVERSIRSAIEIGYERSDIQFWNNIFGNLVSCEKHKPTNSQFIAAVVEYITVM